MAAIDTSCEVDDLANSLYTSLMVGTPIPPAVDLSGASFVYTPDPASVLYEDPQSITLDQLTEVDLDGTGVFDKLMSAVDLHIKREYKDSRITGDQYAAVYTDVMTAVLGQSTAFLLQKDQAKWASIEAQMNARVAEIKATTALIELEKVKVETQKTIFEMSLAGAEYGLTKMKIANADADHCLIKARTSEVEYRYTNLLPAELAIQQFQLNQTLPLQQQTAQYGYDNMLPIQLAKEQHLLNFQFPAQTQLINEQKEVQRSQTQDNRSDSLTPISGLVGRQSSLLDEQKEVQRAQTMDTRSDGSTVIEGSVGKQKDLYDQQIDSFVKDAKQKAAKMYLDGWITQKTLDENLASPNELDVPSVSEVLLSLRNENGL